MITFDRSMPEFAGFLKREGVGVTEGVFVRDVRGRLLYVARAPLPAGLIEQVELKLPADLKPYVSPLGPLADQDTPGASRALHATESQVIHVQPLDAEPSVNVSLLDRATGTDWTHTPEELDRATPRLVFASVTGGVGRSTALCVLAAELARQGRSLLVLDLDLEAPGLGSMLVEESATPKFGSIDFYVEGGLQELDDAFFHDCAGHSWLGAGNGRIDVVPSYGVMSLANPQKVLAKLARAYLETGDENGESLTFLKRTQVLVSRLASLRRYDAILIDARSGLHETTAASILGLGADVLLFGTHKPQTFLGYRILLSNLAQLPVRDPDYDWRFRLRMVHAKAASTDATASYQSKMFDLFDSVFYSKTTATHVDILDHGFGFSLDDQEAPHHAIPVLENEHYRAFDPVRERAQLTHEIYSPGFTSFLRFCIERLQLDGDLPA